VRLRSILLGAAGVLVGIPLLVAGSVAGVYLAHNEISGTIAYGDGGRHYLLHVPANLDRNKPAPLVVSLHGAMGWPSLQRDITGWNRLADERGFIVVYPGGQGDGPKAWFMEGSDDPARMPDVKFIADLLDRAQASHKIDAARIYVEGLSNGGGMAFALACTMPQRIAAVGLVAAAMTLPPQWCTSPAPMPMIAIHGTADTIVPYAGGASPIAPKPFGPVPQWVAQWAARNGCAASAVEQKVAMDLTRAEYTPCTGGASVVFYTVHGGGHQWPGGRLLPEWLLGRRTPSVDATREVWDFFQKQGSRHLPGG
jgi:polyhydroxybutyrate depolymerase